MQRRMEQLEQRTGRLEAWNRVLLIVTGTCLVVILSGAASTRDVVQAGSFQLVSSEGDVRAELVLRDGDPGLYFKDAANVDRVAVFHDADASGVYVMDVDGVTRIGIAQFSHGGGGVALHGPESKGAAVLYFKEEGSLRFFDGDGNVTNQIRASALSGPN